MGDSKKFHIFTLIIALSIIGFLFAQFAMGDSGKGENSSGTPTLPKTNSDSEEFLKDFEPVLDAVTRATTKYMPVRFSTHYKHTKWVNTGCVTCHHTLNKGEEVSDGCTSCHNKPGAEIDLTTAMHKSCKGCHHKIKEKNPKTNAPVSCLSCHTERK